MKLLALLLFCLPLASCASAPPSVEYQRCKSALVDVLTQDLKEGAE
jgi:starvation-inducible outer membrane lipoprotein